MGTACYVWIGLKWVTIKICAISWSTAVWKGAVVRRCTKSGMEPLSFVSVACVSCYAECSKNQKWGTGLYRMRCNMHEKNGTLWLGMEILKWWDVEKVRRTLLTAKRGWGNTLLKCKHKGEGKGREGKGREGKLFHYDTVTHRWRNYTTNKYLGGGGFF